MKIESITTRNILSFGPEQQKLENLKCFNLFIGRNGSGKTSLLRILGDLKTHHFGPISQNDESPQLWKLGISPEYQNEITPRTTPQLGDLVSNSMQ